MAAKRTPGTYLWRTKSTTPGWASEVRLIPTVIDADGAERTTFSQMIECNGSQFGLTAKDKSDVVAVPCCLGNRGGPQLGALVLCDTYTAAGGTPTDLCTRPVLDDRLTHSAKKELGIHVGFTVSATVQSRDFDSRADPISSPLGQALLNAQLGITTIRGASDGVTLEIVVGLGDPMVAADHCELVQAICAGFKGTAPRVSEVWVSTAASRAESGAASLLARLTAASAGAGVAANSREGRFYIPASVAREGKGHYIDQKPARCANSYQYVVNVLDLWMQ